MTVHDSVSFLASHLDLNVNLGFLITMITLLAGMEVIIVLYIILFCHHVDVDSTVVHISTPDSYFYCRGTRYCYFITYSS